MNSAPAILSPRHPPSRKRAPKPIIFRLKRPSHTDQQIKVLGIEQNEHGAVLKIAGAWAGRFDTVADAAAFAEFVQERANA